jgi:hypothetical protein
MEVTNTKNFPGLGFVLPYSCQLKELDLRITRRRVWLLVFLFCFIVWGGVAVVVYASDGSNEKPKNEPDEYAPSINIQKIKKLDLNEQQRKFIESFIESPGKENSE